MKKHIKKILLVSFVVMLISAISCFSARAENYSGECGADGDNITWSLDIGTGKLIISGYGDMCEYWTYPWDSYSSDIKSVIIGSGVTSIGDSAFYCCTNLERLTIGGNVISIGNDAFNSCIRLKSITLPESVTSIGSYAFCGCISLKSITIPDNITSIAYGVFSGCTSLKSITIPKSVTSIYDLAFDECASLTDVYYTGTQTNWKQIDISYGNDCIISATIHCNTYPVHTHAYTTKVTKAILSKNGKVVKSCSICGVEKIETIYYPKTIKLTSAECIYDGKVKTPSVIVKDSKGNILNKGTDYTVKYESGRKAVGTYTVKITFKGNYSGTKKLTFKIILDTTRKISAATSTSAIKLTWKKVTGADGYRIYQYNTKTKKWDTVKTITSGTTVSYKIKDLKAGTKYKFRVKAYTKDDGTIWGENSATFETATKCKTPTLKVTSKNGKAVLNWSNVSGESGYQVYYSTKKDGDYKKVKNYSANTVKGSKSKLKSGKKYYFKVRAYTKTKSGVVYSAWSSVKSVKVK